MREQSQVRWFLSLRNRVVHPSEKGKPSKEELERAGRAAVAALQRALAAQARRGNSARGEPVQREVSPTYPTKVRKVKSTRRKSARRKVSPGYAIGSRRFRRFVVGVIRRLSWRLVFLPELVGLTLLAVMVKSDELWVWLALVSLRFFALFGSDPAVWKGLVLLVVGLKELVIVWVKIEDGLGLLDWVLIPFLLVPGLISLFRAIGLLFGWVR